MLFNAIIEKDEFGYFAQIPELKGCVTQGKTYEEALFNIKEAAELYLESLKIEELKAFQNRTFSITSIEIALNA
jgi:predicted RNase H-like HicB family nuclease